MEPGDIVLDKKTMSCPFIVVSVKPLSQTKLPCVYASIPKHPKRQRNWSSYHSKNKYANVEPERVEKTCTNYAHRSTMIKSDKYGDFNVVHVKALAENVSPGERFLKYHDVLLTPSLGSELFEMMYDLGKGDIYRNAAKAAKHAEEVVKREDFEFSANL